METLSLSSFTAFIRRVFALNLPEPVWVAAELAQVSTTRGHTWLTLVEKSDEDDLITAQLDGVIWASTTKTLQKTHSAKLLREVLVEGMSVRLRVTASFHERYGLKLVVEDIDPEHTVGFLEQRKQTTLANLAADGVLDRNAALPLPSLVQRLAIISADTAAGLADFQDQLRANPYGYAFTTDLYTAAMQGAQTGPEISARLRQIGRRVRDYDAIIIVRGGGGKTDLAAFNDETLCRIVADAPLPVLVGIGHEIDQTVLDRVVHRSLKTPTAVAVYLIEQVLQNERQLMQAGRQIVDRAAQTIRFHQLDVLRRAGTTHQAALSALNQADQRLSYLQSRIHTTAQQSLERTQTEVATYTRLLAALRPEAVLERGFALVSQDGQLITSPEELAPGSVDVRLREGRVRLTY